MHDSIFSVDLAKLQKGQRRHDECAHREILDLNESRRLKHFTFHFAEYAGALFKSRRSGDQESAERALTDSLIIALACANTLDVDLQNECSDFSVTHVSHFELLLQIVEVVGEMAKACEAFDQPAERYLSISALHCAIRQLTGLLLLLSKRMDMDPTTAVVARWRVVEGKAGALVRNERPAPGKSVSVAA